MSSDSGLDNPNNQLEDTEVAPNGLDDGENGGMDDLFGDDEPTETADPDPDAEQAVYEPSSDF